MTEQKAEYSALPVCRLCGCNPSVNAADEYDYVWCSNFNCNLNGGGMSREEWRKLMGVPEGFVLVPAQMPKPAEKYMCNCDIRLEFVIDAGASEAEVYSSMIGEILEQAND